MEELQEKTAGVRRFLCMDLLAGKEDAQGAGAAMAGDGAAGVGFVNVVKLTVFCNGSLDGKYAIYKWHILMILPFVINKKVFPSIQNKKVEPYFQKIIAVCSQADEGCLNAFEEAIEVLNKVGLGATRDDIRSQAYTLKILAYCNKNYK